MFIFLASSILILSNLIEYCNDNNVTIATGESAQVDQAFSLGIATTAV